MPARLVFDTESDMEDYLETHWDTRWVKWPTLPDGAEWEPEPIVDYEIDRQVRVAFAGHDGVGEAPVDLIATRRFRTADMPADEHLASCVMLIELKNDALSHAHVDQILRYFEAHRRATKMSGESPDLVCCALIGTALRADLRRIARSIPFLGVYSWELCGRDVYLAKHSGELRGEPPLVDDPFDWAETPQPANVIDIGIAKSGNDWLNDHQAKRAELAKHAASMSDEELRNRSVELSEKIKAAGTLTAGEGVLREKDVLLGERYRRLKAAKRERGR